MKYFLVLGIEYKKYKKPAYITIHVGEKFIDTFQLDRDFLSTTDVISQIESKWYENYGRPQYFTRPDWVNTWKRHKLPRLFKVYELDDNDLEGKISISVDNSNSDFTNGFIKNSSLIKLAIPALVKKDSVANRGEKIVDDLIKLDWRTSNKRWPVADSFKIIREKNSYEPPVQGDRWWWIGGSFTAEFEIVKKHDTKYLGLIRKSISGKSYRTIHPDDLVVASWTKLLNIYDENQ
jgi:hypothetical protein